MKNLNPDPHLARPAPSEIWRTWLITGARGHPIDRRRLQGEHRGLKQVLSDSGEVETLRRPWSDFSRAMHRQSVNEAMTRLTARERVVLTMAYFAGFSNTEIAEELGMTARGVQRSLRRALDRLSDAMQQGRRIALGVAGAFASGRVARWVADHAAPAGTQAIAAAAVVSVIAIAPAPADAARPGPAHAQPPAASAGAPPSALQHVVPAPAAAPSDQKAAPSTSGSAIAPAPAAPSPVIAPSPSQLPSVSVPKVTVPAVKLPAVKPPAPLKKTLRKPVLRKKL